VADDHPHVLAAFGRMLQSACEIVASVANGHAAVEAVSRLRPDVLVVDLMMPDLDGLEVCRRVKQLAPATDVVIVTAFDDAHVQTIALHDGASAFVPKHSVDTLEETIQRISLDKQVAGERVK
jgi:CheY-like chemotaxis protein